MTSRREEAAASRVFADIPGVLVIPRADAVQIVHFRIEQIADQALSQDGLDDLEKRVPA